MLPLIGPHMNKKCSIVLFFEAALRSPVIMGTFLHRYGSLRDKRLTALFFDASFLLFFPQRLTLGQMVAEFQSGQRGQKLEVVRIGGTGCVLIKQGRKPQLGSAPTDVVLDVDVSLRHADITLGMDECIGLYSLSSAYVARIEQPAEDVVTEVLDIAVATKPVKPLFREDFWYFEGDNDNGSGELNFDTLSDLLGQVGC